MTIGKTLGDLEILPKAEETGAGQPEAAGLDQPPATPEPVRDRVPEPSAATARSRTSPDPLRATDRYRLVTPYPAKI